jgi:hypothetical protein
MAYRNFNFTKIEQEFGITPVFNRLFQESQVLPLPLSQYLTVALENVSDMPLTTEKMLSEALIFPILQEIRQRNKKNIHLFSGEILNVDKKKGLNGECDFIITKSNVPSLSPPILYITEAKYGEPSDLDSLAQTVAQMIGAKILNQREHSYETIFGACSSGYEWLFMKLDRDHVYIDTQRYSIQNMPLLLGTLQHIIDFYK